jgi:hypothetical protein
VKLLLWRSSILLATRSFSEVSLKLRRSYWFSSVRLLTRTSWSFSHWSSRTFLLRSEHCLFRKSVCYVLLLTLKSLARSFKFIIIIFGDNRLRATQDYVTQLATVREETLKEAGTKIVVIGCGDWQPIASYASAYFSSEYTFLHLSSRPP